MAIIAVIRLRGTADLNRPIRDTLKMLRLHKPNHMVLIKKTPIAEGMLRKVWAQVTWGEINVDTLAYVLERRGRKPGNKPFTLDDVKKLGFSSYKELAEAIIKGEFDLKNLYKIIKPVFRLHPPSKGFKGSIKRGYRDGGELGYRGDDINRLILRMA